VPHLKQGKHGGSAANDAVSNREQGGPRITRRQHGRLEAYIIDCFLGIDLNSAVGNVRPVTLAARQIEEDALSIPVLQQAAPYSPCFGFSRLQSQQPL
jgi:hypothetical protein